MKSVLIVEDSSLVAAGLRATLDAHPELTIVGVVASVEDAETWLRQEPIDLAVVDVRLADGTAFDLLRRLGDATESVGFLIVSSFDLAQYVDAALRLGASGYILKTAPTDEIISAALAVASGGWAFNPELVRNAARWTRLSPRDRQVIQGVMEGRSNDEIGTVAQISRKTVEAHVSKLLARFDAASRAELAARAARGDWLAMATSSAESETGRPSPRRASGRSGTPHLAPGTEDEDQNRLDSA